MNDILIQFWSDIENVKRASSEDIQSDILAYLEQRAHYKQLAEERGEALETAIMWLQGADMFVKAEQLKIMYRKEQ